MYFNILNYHINIVYGPQFHVFVEVELLYAVISMVLSTVKLIVMPKNKHLFYAPTTITSCVYLKDMLCSKPGKNV